MAEQQKQSEKPSPPATGASISIGGRDYRVHCDCKDVRDNLERRFREKALRYVDEMLREKLILPAEYAAQRVETFAEIKRGNYSYGSNAFSDLRTGTDDGIKLDLYERIIVDLAASPSVPPTPPPTVQEVFEWADANKIDRKARPDAGPWTHLFELFALADGFAPKS